MASILLNVIENDTTYINNLSKTKVFDNFFNKNLNLFNNDNYLTHKMDESYNFRPDKVAFEIYGDDFYYPIILFCNEIGSQMFFTVDILGTEIKYLDPKLLPQIQL